MKGAAACDYTAKGAPRRLIQLGEEGIELNGRSISEDEVSKLAKGRFAFINVWRSIDDESPVLRDPIAICDERTIREEDKFVYELRFPSRTGENYSLQFSNEHDWYYYSKQTKDECLVFKVYDKQENGTRFVFHRSFDDPNTPRNAPARKSIEVRAICFFDTSLE